MDKKQLNKKNTSYTKSSTKKKVLRKHTNIKKKTKKKGKAFTLIELLAVIIILGILMVIAIPSVTSYISDSRKNSYISTAKEVTSDVRNKVNEGTIRAYDTGTTYYVPISCTATENALKSPYGDFTEAYVGVTYTGTGYNYYWISNDTAGQGIRNITSYENLENNLIEANIEDSEIKETIEKTGIDGRGKILILKDDCKTWDDEKRATKEVDANGNNVIKLAAIQIKETGLSNSQLVSIGDNNYIFKGGNPSNYVRFNNETWRIIGIYNDQLKIIHGNSIGRYQYDYGSGMTAINYPTTQLKTFLNESYYSSLKAEDKLLVDENGVWNVGEAKNNSTASIAYQNSKTNTWSGAVGLMSTYEFLYAASDESCYAVNGNSYYTCGNRQNDWMTPASHDAWTITPHYYDANRGVPLNISPSGYVSYGSGNAANLWIYPSVYLKSSVSLVSGTGTSSDPYILG